MVVQCWDAQSLMYHQVVSSTGSRLGVADDTAHCFAFNGSQCWVETLDHNRSIVIRDYKGVSTQGGGISM